MRRFRIALLGVLACLLLPLAGPAQPQTQDDLRQGLAALSRNDLVHARECLERASQADPRNAVVWIALAQTYLKSGQKDMAARAAGRAEQFGASTPPVQHALALYYAGTGEFAKAAEWERRFAASPGAGAQAVSSAAVLSLDAGQADEAVKWAEAALRGADSPETHHLLGKAYQAAGRPDSALPELRRAFEWRTGARGLPVGLWAGPSQGTGTSRRPWLYWRRANASFQRTRRSCSPMAWPVTPSAGRRMP